MQETMSALFMLLGTFFMFIASVGIIRMPDLFLRMSATSKSATLGVGFVLLAVAVYFDDLGVTCRALATILFVFLTAPIAAHRIGRAAYFVGVPLWEGTRYDDLRGRYDINTHVCTSPPELFPEDDLEQALEQARRHDQEND